MKESPPLSPQETESATICDLGGLHENQHEIALKFWSRSLKKSENYDKKLVDTWKGDADGILIFTGLFSSTVASFIIESYKTLQRDSGDATVQLLTQISGQLAAISNGSVIATPPPLPQFRVSSRSVRVNALWFLSLCLSLTCALVATLMQQWSRNYLQMAQGHRSDPAAQARLRAFVFDGVSRFHMSHALGLVPLLLHVSVILFFLGMIEFLFPINNTVTFVVLGFIIAMACTYLLLTVLPLFCLNFPYSTPFSPLVWRLTSFPARALSSLHWLTLTLARFWTTYKWDLKHWKDARDDTLFNVPSFYHQFRIGLRKRLAAQAVQTDASVLGKQLIRELDTTEDVDEIEAFFEGIHAALTVDGAFRPVMTYLVEHQMLLSFRFQCLFDSCDMSLPESIRHRRALVGVRAVWDVFSLKPEEYPFRLLIGAPFESASARSWSLAMMPLLFHEVRTVAVAARCIQAIVASNAVTKASPPSEDPADLDALYALVNPPPDLQQAMAINDADAGTDTDSLRANGGLIVLINLLADLAIPLGAGDALSAQIAQIVGEVVPWLFPPWELRVRVVPAVRQALADACAAVYALALVDGQPPPPPLSPSKAACKLHSWAQTHSAKTETETETEAEADTDTDTGKDRGTVAAATAIKTSTHQVAFPGAGSRLGPFAKLVEELRTLLAFVSVYDEPPPPLQQQQE
ncbi:hypothetical protein B0F90DRAFT_1760714 [Multifurca ochricompacta]|uniref:DUF6535 domain-containing protein n=1 Tax=Multifurca ochricompacta TaxID=376703 RepID=A0AAD4QK90_9AGAM|nr:hypothetical protein B0F90DRAFT_1760714 [Multifurca ochricompacta]